MALQLSQSVALDILADGSSTSIELPTENLLSDSQVSGNPNGVEITNSGFGAEVTATGSLNGTGTKLTLNFSPAPPAGHGTVRFNLLFPGD